MQSWTNSLRQLKNFLEGLFRGWCRVAFVFLTGLAALSSAHAVSIDISIGEFALFTRLYDTVYVNDPVPKAIRFQLMLEKSEGSFDTGSYDVYYGAVLPNKTIVSWQQDTTPGWRGLKFVLGLLPLARNVSLNTRERPIELQLTAGNAVHTFTPADPLGDYQIFCILVRPGAEPSEMRNWAGFASKILAVK